MEVSAARGCGVGLCALFHWVNVTAQGASHTLATLDKILASSKEKKNIQKIFPLTIKIKLIHSRNLLFIRFAFQFGDIQ